MIQVLWDNHLSSAIELELLLMRINIITGPYFPVPPLQGGACEKEFFALAQQFQASGHEVTVCSRSFPGLPDKEEVKGVKFLRVKGFQQAGVVLNLIRDFFYALRWIRNMPAADVILINDVALSCLARFLPATALKIACLGRYPKANLHFYTNLDAIICPSSAITQAVQSRFSVQAGRVFTIPLSIDQKATALAPEHIPTVDFLYVGRIHPEKGLELLITAFMELTISRPALRLKLVGPWEKDAGGGGAGYLAKLKDIAGPQVEFADAVYDRNELAAVYSSARIFCYPSLAEQGETFGRSVLEAMSHGLLPVVSDLNCFKDLVIPGQTGIIFNHRHEAHHELVVALERALEKITDQPGLKDQLELGLRKFHTPAVAARYIELFQSLLTT